MNKMTRTWVSALAAVVSWSASGAGTGLDRHPVPVELFANQLRGPYQTGTFEEMWVDEAREEATTLNPTDKRRLMVQVWYPAAFKGNPPRAPYLLHPGLYSREPELLRENPKAHWVYAGWLDDVLGVRTNSVLDAPLAPAPKRFPVLLYNPGAGFAAFSATFQTEFLASHGYVVVGISHTESTGIERFPDGSTYRLETNNPELSSEQAEALTPVENFHASVERYLELLMPVQVQDIRFVLDRLAQMDRERGNRFQGRLDLERVGSLGWSLGGALSLQASRDEPRIKAAVNLDGWLFTDVQNTGTPRPVMVIHGDDPFGRESPEPAAERERRLVAETQPWHLYARMQADWYDVTLERGGHMHFSDLSLLMPEPVRQVFLPGPASARDPGFVHDVSNQLILEFFDKYLRSGEARLLCGGRTQPGVSVRGRSCH